MARLITVTEDNAIELFHERMKKRKEIFAEIKNRLGNGILINEELEWSLKENGKIISSLLEYIIEHRLVFR